MDFSIWWLLAAFIAGSWAGILLVALMHMSGDSPEQSTRIPEMDLFLTPH